MSIGLVVKELSNRTKGIYRVEYVFLAQIVHSLDLQSISSNSMKDRFRTILRLSLILSHLVNSSYPRKSVKRLKAVRV